MRHQRRRPRNHAPCVPRVLGRSGLARHVGYRQSAVAQIMTLQSILDACTNPDDFARAYAVYLGELVARIEPGAIGRLIEELELARTAHHKVFIAGNGGSSSTAAHMVNDLCFGARPGDGGAGLDARCLSDNVPLLTAIANDHAYELVFVRQLEMAYRPGDRLIVLSASGNSPNIVRAAAWVKERGGVVIGLVGFNGGELRSLCDVLIHIKTANGEYGPVEDLHLVIDHVVTVWLQSRARHLPAASGETARTA